MTEENKYLDKLFESKFAGFEAEPPAAVWNNIHQELHGKKGGSINPINLATIAALVLISGLLGFSIIKDVPVQSSEINHSELTSALHALAVDEPATDNLSAVSPDKGETTPTAAINQPSPAVPSAKTTSIPDSGHDHETSHQLQQSNSYGLSFNEQSRAAKLRTYRSLALHAGIASPNSSNIQVRDSQIDPRYSKMVQAQSSYNRKASWQMGVFFTPAVSFYPDDSISNQRSYTFDVSAKWIKNEFFVESGLGVSFSSDDGKYEIDYEQFLGSYDDVYNVTYDTTTNGAIVPVYHTNVVDVYDSVSRYSVDKTTNNYTYLQIPVYIGFSKNIDRFSWFVKGGPILSVLIHQNIPDPDAGYNRIIGLDQQMATRVNTNWQLAISAGISYSLSNKVSLALEPTFRYYLNSQYESKYISTKHPYTIGLRTGLLFNF